MRGECLESYVELSGFKLSLVQTIPISNIMNNIYAY